MSAIFQLFSAQDLLWLANLSPSKLNDLRQFISNEMAYSSAVRAQIKIRADQVFCQLVPSFTPPRPLPQLPAPPAPLPPLPDQFFIRTDLVQLNADKLKILEWAIRCEKDNSPLVLDLIMQAVYAWFAQQVPPSQPTPDATYSLFTKAYQVARAANPPTNFRIVIRPWPTNLWGP